MLPIISPTHPGRVGVDVSTPEHQERSRGKIMDRVAYKCKEGMNRSQASRKAYQLAVWVDSGSGGEERVELSSQRKSVSMSNQE